MRIKLIRAGILSDDTAIDACKFTGWFVNAVFSLSIGVCAKEALLSTTPLTCHGSSPARSILSSVVHSLRLCDQICRQFFFLDQTQAKHIAPKE